MEKSMAKKLIEVALPLAAINEASAREKSIRHGHPSTLHLWWARRPLAAARAVLFAQLVDDPSAHPEIYPTEEDQHEERERLFRIIEELVKWENTTNQKLFESANEEIRKSWRLTCAENASHPRASELFNPDILPAFHDPFAGGGAIPLEAQRLGLESYASDLNPVAVLINKAMIEIPPKFANKAPVNPKAREKTGVLEGKYSGAKGLAADVSYYGNRMREEAERRIGEFYPKINITPEMTLERPDLLNYQGESLTVIAYLWTRTVHSPNPAYSKIEVPLISSCALSTKAGKEAWVDPVIREDQSGYDFKVRIGGKPRIEGTVKRSGGGTCIMSGAPMPFEYLRAEGKAGRMGSRLMAIVCEGDRGRVYLSPTTEQEELALKSEPLWKPELALPDEALGFRVQLYGMNTFGDLFTSRQLLALTTFSDLIPEIIAEVERDAIAAGWRKDEEGLAQGGIGAKAYAQAVGIYLVLLQSQLSNHSSSACSWNAPNGQMRAVFSRQAIAMNWDFAEVNPFSKSSGSFFNLYERLLKGLAYLAVSGIGTAEQVDAQTQSISLSKIISTDPPYYDNIGYADLSDFFYVWLRKNLESIYPDIFATLAVPKAEELVATPYRHGSKEGAEAFFMQGMTYAMAQLANLSLPNVPVTIYYAFKQSETDEQSRTSSTGWETFLEAVSAAGFGISGTWPMRTEKEGRTIGIGSNALASSIVLVCRKREESARIATRGEFISALRIEMPVAFARMQATNIAPVDLAQASIGPGMAIFTSFSKVINADGERVGVKEALSLINQTLDEVVAEQEGDFDGDTRWAISWFEQYGFDAGEFGVAETLSKAKNTSISGVVEGGIATSGQGKVRLLRPSELDEKWDPSSDKRLSAWEALHQLIRVLQAEAEVDAARLVAKLGSTADACLELAYRLYVVSERKGRASDGLLYNSLVQSWKEILTLKGSIDVGNSGAQDSLF
jgi:putative DNA methylase